MQQFRYFLAVAQELNISRAAEKLFISQQALSAQMIKLEQYYKVPLFVRTSRGRILSLTTYGEKLVTLAQNILEQEASFRNECSNLSGDFQGRLRFGITPTLTRLLLPLIFPQFSSLFPNVELIVKTDNFASLKESMINGQLDILLGFGHDHMLTHFCSTHLVNERVYVVLRKDLLNRYYTDPAPERLVPFVSQIRFSSLGKITCLIPPRGNYTHKIMTQIFSKTKIAPNIIMGADSGDILIQMASSGTGAAFCLKSIIIERMALFDPASDNALYAFPLQDEEALVDLALYYPENLRSSDALLAFSGIVKRNYQELYRIASEKLIRSYRQ